MTKFAVLPQSAGEDAIVVNRGFSLLELLIALAVAGLLMAIALPAYQRSAQAGGRAEGQILLLQVAADQERFYASHHSYSLNASPLTQPARATLTSAGELYEVEVEACDGGAIDNCFVAIATPLGGQALDECGTLTLSSTGMKGASGSDPGNCWR